MKSVKKMMTRMNKYLLKKVNSVISACSKTLHKVCKPVVKAVKSTFKKLQKGLAVIGIHISVDSWHEYRNMYLMFKYLGININLYRKTPCIVAASIGLTEWSLTLLNLSVTVTLQVY